MATTKAAKASIWEYKCAICLQLLIEPVVLPCKHEMCRPCFRKNVEEANFLCPMCRIRISSWARKCIREGTLVDQTRWNLIQRLFPEKCLKRLKGDDDESEDESYQPPPKRVLAKTGELRKEYEQEKNKILQLKEEEEQASKNFIENILHEEQAIRLKQQNQEKEDELLARKLSEEFKQTQENKEGTLKRVGNGLKSQDFMSWTKSKDSRKKTESSKSPGNSHTLERYFFPKNETFGNSSASVMANNVQDEDHYKSDYELALRLQKQFDKEAVATNKRDDYMLRKTVSNHNEQAFTCEKESTCKSGEHEKNELTTNEERVKGKILQVIEENTRPKTLG